MAEQDFTINIRTTADAKGIAEIEKSLANLKKQVAEAGGDTTTDAQATEAYRLGRRLNLLATAAVVSTGYKFVEQLHEAATYIEKISDELDKQGDQLVKNGKKYAEMSRFAQDNADVIKIGEGALKGVEAAQKRALDAAQENLKVWQKIADVWAAGFRVEGPIAATLRLKQEQTSQLFEAERQNAILAIRAAKTTEARHATQTYQETVAELTDRMKEQEALAATHWLQQDISSYLSAASAAEKYKNELESLKAAHDKLTSKTEKYIEGAEPQVKAILANEKAMFEARAAGRGRDADLFERTALNLRKSARPEQLEDLAKIYSSPVVEEALKQIGINTRTLVDLWK